MMLGYALAVAPVIWQSFNEKERANVENWLGNSINEKKYVQSRDLFNDTRMGLNMHTACRTRTGYGSESSPILV
jgi:hypothetical protein